MEANIMPSGPTKELRRQVSLSQLARTPAVTVGPSKLDVQLSPTNNVNDIERNIRVCVLVGAETKVEHNANSSHSAHDYYYFFVVTQGPLCLVRFDLGDSGCRTGHGDSGTRGWN